MFIYCAFLDAFSKLWKVYINISQPKLYPTHITTLQSLNSFILNCVLSSFIILCKHIRILIEIEKKNNGIFTWPTHVSDFYCNSPNAYTSKSIRDATCRGTCDTSYTTRVCMTTGGFWIKDRILRPSGQSCWLQIQRSRVRFPALSDILWSSGSGTGSTQPRESYTEELLEWNNSSSGSRNSRSTAVGIICKTCH
jgi:hypothetical protein